jgi:hypothetical protein
MGTCGMGGDVVVTSQTLIDRLRLTARWLEAAAERVPQGYARTLREKAREALDDADEAERKWREGR